MQMIGNASDKQLSLSLSLALPGDEPWSGNRTASDSVQPSPWMNCRIISANSGRISDSSCSGRPTDRNRFGGSPFPSPTAVLVHWVFPPCWITLSSRPSPRWYRKIGSPGFTHTAMASARGAQRTRPWDTHKAVPGQAITGWWIWTSKPSLTG